MSFVTGQGRPPTAVELLERAIAYTRASLLLVTEADLGRPTPCAGWVLRDLLAHMDDSLEAMAVAAQATSLSLVPPDAAGRRRRPDRQHLSPGVRPPGPLAPVAAAVASSSVT